MDDDQVFLSLQKTCKNQPKKHTQERPNNNNHEVENSEELHLKKSELHAVPCAFLHKAFLICQDSLMFSKCLKKKVARAAHLRDSVS